jgi:hypothetical protein
MKIDELLYDCECVIVDEDGNILDEGAVRQWKKTKSGKVMKYRCKSGPKKGRLVSKPGGCATRKDPKRKRIGKKVMRSKKNVIARKSKISKRKGISKMLSKLNARLMGKT